MGNLSDWGHIVRKLWYQNPNSDLFPSSANHPVVPCIMSGQEMFSIYISFFLSLLLPMLSLMWVSFLYLLSIEITMVST